MENNITTNFDISNLYANIINLPKDHQNLQDLITVMFNSSSNDYFLSYLVLIFILAIRTKLYETNMLGLLVIVSFVVTILLSPIINEGIFIHLHSVNVSFCFLISLLYFIQEINKTGLNALEKRYSFIMTKIPFLLTTIYMFINFEKYNNTFSSFMDFYAFHMLLISIFITYITFYPIYLIYLQRKNEEEKNRIMLEKFEINIKGNRKTDIKGRSKINKEINVDKIVWKIERRKRNLTNIEELKYRFDTKNKTLFKIVSYGHKFK